MTNKEFKKTLWDIANTLRGSVSAAEYKHPVLGLVFLKYVSDMFDAQAKVIRDRITEPTSEYYIDAPAMRANNAEVFTGDKTFYDQDNVFWVSGFGRHSHCNQSGLHRDAARWALSPIYLFFWTRANMDSIKQKANGSTFMEISKSAFRPIKLSVPPPKLVDVSSRWHHCSWIASKQTSTIESP